jgi:hypothetical protein
LFSLSFIFFSVIVICLFIVNVDNKTLTHWRRDSDMNAFISSIDLSRKKLLIALIMYSLRLFIESSFNVVRILVKTSRRLMSDDITSIRAKDFCLFTIDRLLNQVKSTSRVWLLMHNIRFTMLTYFAKSLHMIFW